MKIHKTAAVIFVLLFVSLSTSHAVLQAGPRPQKTADTPAEMQQILQDLKSDKTDQVIAACTKLKDMGEQAAPAIPDLIALLRYTGLESFTEGSQHFAAMNVSADFASQALAGIGKPAIGPLRAALVKPESAEDRVRWTATALAKIQDPEAARILIGVLSQPAFKERAAVASALGFSSDATARDALLTLAKDPDPALRRGAVEGLGRRTDTQAVLVQALGDQDSEVRRAAASGLMHAALNKQADPAVTEPLIAALKDPDDTVRNYASQALGAIKDDRAVEPLITVVAEDKESLVRFQAGRALQSITGQKFGDNGSRWQQWWRDRSKK